MGKALYRKYRSKSLDEIVGQPHITTTLGNAIKTGDISHAYLFTGPRGTGKTSIARILAHEVNGIPYKDDSMHLDIIEIDAASNRRIDEIRELRERVHVAPTSAKYKIYIIDEVHMLTKEAFNALLKTLEEPPAHVIFMLATTEAHKLPDTIISRTQRFTFKPVEQSQVIDHLSYIAKQEKLAIDKDSLELVAQHGGGSFRDSISLLDQLRGYGDKVSLEDVQSMLGIAPGQAIDELIAAVQGNDPGELVRVLASFKEHGYQAGQIAKQLAARLRQYLLSGSSPIAADQITMTLQKLLTVPATHDPEASLEIALLDVVLQNADGAIEITTLPKPAPAAEAPKTDPVPPKETVAQQAKSTVTKPADEQIINEPVTVKDKPASKPSEDVQPKQHSELDADAWNSALATIKRTHNTLYSVARMATPMMNGDELTLKFKFAFHQKRINEAKNKDVIANIIEKVIGKPVTIICTVDSKTSSAAPKAAAVTPPVSTAKTIDTFSNISNIFGGAEVLES